MLQNSEASLTGACFLLSFAEVTTIITADMVVVIRRTGTEDIRRITIGKK